MKVVIVGAGQAGASAAAFLRQFGFAGEIVLIGDEPRAPYQRPPLSKAWLKGDGAGDALQLRPEGFYAEQQIELRLDARAVELDRNARVVRLADGAAVAYDALILATGASARPLPVPGADHPGVLTLRTLADAGRLKAVLRPGRRLTVVGAGYVGLEVAATARGLGCEVAVVEREPRVLARVASTPLSTFFEGLHRDRGVDILTGAGVSAIENDARDVRLADGRVIEGDAVLVGVGAAPREALALAAGLAAGDGIVVDAQACTSDPDIYAIGDCTRRPLPLYGSEGRLESVPNALEQARQAAAAIAGAPPPAAEVPWFWSEQYEAKLQIAGLAHQADRLVVRGDPMSARFAVFHLRGDIVHAVEAVNAPQDFIGGKQLIARRQPINPVSLGDPTVAMKAVQAA